MTLTSIEALDRLDLLIAKKEYHKHHDHMVKLAEFGHDMVTNKVEDYLEQINGRETKELKEQRNRLNNPLTGFVCGQVINPFKKVRRTDGVREVIKHQDSSFQEHLQQVSDKFFGDMSLKEYIHSMGELLNMTDANAFIVFRNIEQINESGGTEYPLVHPVLMFSKSVRTYDKSNGSLDWVVFETMRKGKERPLSEFFFYHAGYLIHYVEVDKDENETIEGYDVHEVTGPKTEDRSFLRRVYENATQQIPVIQLGVYLDPDTSNETYRCLPAIAKPQFIDLIRNKSYEDLLIALHAFLKEWVYGPECKTCEGSGEVDGEVCHSCGGKGITMPAQQEVVRIVLPNDEGAFFPLKDLHDYAALPTETPELLDKKIKEAANRVIRAVYNSDTFTQEQIQTAATATEVTIDNEAINDVLDPYGVMVARSMVKSWQIIAEYCEKGEGLEAEYAIPYDKGVESVNQLMVQLKAAKEGGADHAIIAGINDKILRKTYRNNPEQLKQMQAFQQFIPFGDKSREEIGLILSGRADDDFDKVAWENSETIIRRIKNRGNEAFYMLTYEAQERIWNEQVELIIESISVRQSAPVGLPSFIQGDEPPTAAIGD
ncbi:MAG: hypothetical protein AAGH79_08490 [Bacteroidota bacterium]